MNSSFHWRWTAQITRELFASVCFIMAISGCDSVPSVGTVEGIVMVKGQPADKVRVEFHPDERRGTRGPSSFGQTDAQGRFTLVTGVAIGWHKVVVQDMRLAASETGKGVATRFGPEYSRVLSTPLEAEVKLGAQSITIAVPKN